MRSREEAQKIAEQNLGLVRKVAHKFQCHNETIDDLINVGVIGLMRAARRFDESRGYRFSTYAVPMIKGEIQHYLLRFQGELVKYPEGTPRRRIYSLDVPIAPDSEQTHLDVIPSPHFEDEDLDEVRSLVRQLPTSQRRAVELVYFQDLTQAEAATRLGVSPQTIHKSLRKAEARLKHWIKSPQAS